MSGNEEWAGCYYSCCSADGKSEWLSVSLKVFFYPCEASLCITPARLQVTLFHCLFFFSFVIIKDPEKELKTVFKMGNLSVSQQPFCLDIHSPDNSSDTLWHKELRQFWRHRFNKIMETPIRGISHCSTSRRCSIWLTSISCGGHSSTENLWSCSSNMVCYPGGSNYQKMGTLWLQRDGPGHQQYSGRL